MIGWLTAYAARLRFPTLFAIVSVIFLIDLFVPDLIPFADEVLLGLLTVLLGTLRSEKARRESRSGDGGVIVDVEPTATSSGDARRPGES